MSYFIILFHKPYEVGIILEMKNWMSQNNLLKVSGVAIAEPEFELSFEGPKVLHCFLLLPFT